MQFDAGGQYHDSREQGYFEAGEPYRVLISVDQDMKVTVDTKLE